MKDIEPKTRSSSTASTFINETNKFENRLGKTRDEEKMLAVKKLMLDSLLNFRFRGTTLNYEELPIALENIIIDMCPELRRPDR